MKNKSDIIIIVLLLCVLSFTLFYREDISNFILEKFIFQNDVIIVKPNEYALDYDFEYVKPTNDFYAKDKNQILNIFYTSLNNGAEEFYFFCRYEECEDDVNEIANQNEVVNINNFVHPYNSYRKINISINNLHKVSVAIEKTYSADTIVAVNKKIEEITSSIIKEDMTLQDKIKVFHDYIIDNSKYDMSYIESGMTDIDSPSHKATGPLFYNKALCGGYADTMSVFLNQLNIPNYRIASEFHVWNLVQIDNTWHHLDLTWDDPVTNNGTDVLLHSFFLISTEELQKMNTGYHNYNHNIYKEA